MIDITQSIRRTGFLWDGVTAERVERYLKELSEFKDGLEKFNYAQERVLGVAKDRIENMLSLIKEEFDICNFYLFYLEVQKEDNFNAWFSVKEEDRAEVLSEQEYYIKGDCWVRYNGKVRAIININRKAGSQMVRTSLHIENNSEHLNFFFDGYTNRRKEIAYSHLKNEERILKRVEEYKEKADGIMSKLQYPHYCAEKANLNILSQLLHVEETEQ